MARRFKPRNPIPKKKLIKDLEEGLTLDEIGQKYNKSRSFISESLSMHNIKIDDISGRKQAMKERKRKLENRSFVDVLYDRIKK